MHTYCKRTPQPYAIPSITESGTQKRKVLYIKNP